MNDEITPEMRARADARVTALRAQWQAKDAEVYAANRAFEAGFRRGLRAPMGSDWFGDWLRSVAK